jgi:twinkle protein
MQFDEEKTYLYKTSCDCGSSNAKQWFAYPNKPNDSYCFSCKTFFPPEKVLATVVPIQTNKVQNTMMQLDDIKKLPIRDIPDRKITKEVCELYRVRVSVSESDGETITNIYSPDTVSGNLVGYEQKQVKDKQFFSIGDRKGNLDLWGKHYASKCGGQKLYITEGRLDCLSLYEVIVQQTPDTFKHLKPSVVSLTKGCTSAVKDLINNRVFLENYKEVILCFDMDEPGQNAVKEVLKVFPLCKVAKLPLKDSSDMLMQGRKKELYEEVVWRSSVQRQGEVVQVTDELIQQALVRPKMGLTTCWASLDKLTYGLHPHQIVCLAHIQRLAKASGKTN